MNMNMSIDPIEINVADNKTFGQLAFRFDKPSFLKDVKRSRRKLGINKLVGNRLVEGRELKVGRAWARYTPAQQEAAKHYGISGVTILTDADLETEKLVKKYNFPILFVSAVKHAIMSGKVTEKNLERKAECVLIEPEDYLELAKQGTYEEPFLAIQFTSDASEKDILKAFRGRKSVLRDYRRVAKKRNKEPDTISNIKRDRDWYWKNIKGMSYGKIWSGQKGISKEGVAQAIEQYKKRLESV